MIEESVQTPHSMVPVLGWGFEPETFNAPTNVRGESRLTSTKKYEKVFRHVFQR